MTTLNEYLHPINTNTMQNISSNNQQQALSSLESGQIIYFPNTNFRLNAAEKILFNTHILDHKHKNVSYDYKRHKLGGCKHSSPAILDTVQNLMHRFADYSQQLIATLLPNYAENIQLGRTSYRPAEIKNRSCSKRQDDTRLHVDSFTSTPVHGLRILRLFYNINPNAEPRIWHIGEPLKDVITRFAPNIDQYSAWRAHCLKYMQITKTVRSKYDHYMLKLHNHMKEDDNYQQIVNKTLIKFPAQSSWLVFTDQVSHAALSGQFLLEQTFYLPITAMQNPNLSPLKQWERLLGA